MLEKTFSFQENNHFKGAFIGFLSHFCTILRKARIVCYQIVNNHNELLNNCLQP